ncbi:hypothetical protein EDC96DRAFT_581579 [Choanephora cucurbitarum]|nr:hypothetical protein EDC96DRAFT_581579 [Choanephora cucurbitarum]
MYPCISCSAVFNSEEERLYHLRYDRCVSVAGQAALSARRNQQQTITDDALAAVMAATEMPINMEIDEDSPVTSENEVAVDDAVVNENVDSEMPEADNAGFSEGHDQFSNPIILNWLPPRSMNSFDEMALEFMCLLDEAKTARLYQRRIVKLVNKMLGESANPDVVRHIPSPDVFRRTIKRDTKSIVKHDICVSGCFMYPVNEPGMKTCPNEECGQARYCNEAEVQAAMEELDREDGMPLPDLIPTRQIAYTSLGSALTEIYVDEDRSEMLIEGASLSEVQQRLVTHYRDVFSGSVYKQLLVSEKIMANTICVVVFVDAIN